MGGLLLLVNHNPAQLESWRRRLEEWKVPFLHTRDPFAALQILHLEKIIGIICREDLPILSGEELRKRVFRVNPSLTFIALPSCGGAELGRVGWKHGELTFREAGFIKAVGTILLSSGMMLKENKFKELLRASDRYPGLIGQSAAIREVFALMNKVKDQDVTVLIRGESGTGKELVAGAIHRCGSRAGRQFISVNCAALPETLLESELFGHEKGAFTGADSRVIGRFEQADGGCLFLDEIGDMSFKTQAKILRLLEGSAFERLGGREEIKVDVRIIAATNRDLEEGVQEKHFREDLYYRIGAFPIFLPPLRDRVEDIPLLVAGILRDFNQSTDEPVTGMTVRAIKLLCQHDWKGNVRQLQNVVRRAAILSPGGVISEKQINLTPPGNIQEEISPPPAEEKIMPINGESRIRSLAEVEREAIAKALQIANMNISRTARGLGISRATLYKKIRDYGLADPRSQTQPGPAEIKPRDKFGQED